MLAARYYKGKDNVVVEEVPIPQIGPNEVLVRLQGIGVCHSDLHVIEETFTLSKYPITFGHEGAGVVEKVGDGVRNFKAGDKVALYYLITCGECSYCITGRENLCDNPGYMGFGFDGSWAEYVAVPSQALLMLPDGVGFQEGALAGCAVVTPFHANVVGRVSTGKSVAIIGIGGVGFNGLMWSKIAGASPIIAVDISDSKLEKAQEAGATHVVNAKKEDPVEAIRRFTEGKGADVTFEYIGLKQTVEQAIRATKKGGVSVMVGIANAKIEIDALDFLGKGGEFRAVQNHTRDQMITVLNMIRDKKIDVSKSISHTLKLEKAPEAVEMLRSQKGDPRRIVLEP